MCLRLLTLSSPWLSVSSVSGLGFFLWAYFTSLLKYIVYQRYVGEKLFYLPEYLFGSVPESLCRFYNSKWTVTFPPPWQIPPTVSWLLLLLIRNQMRGHGSFAGMSFLPACSWDLFLLCCSFFLFTLLGIRCASPVQGFVFPWFLENVQHFSLAYCLSSILPCLLIFFWNFLLLSSMSLNLIF